MIQTAWETFENFRPGSVRTSSHWESIAQLGLSLLTNGTAWLHNCDALQYQSYRTSRKDAGDRAIESSYGSFESRADPCASLSASFCSRVT
jgi:hypothetical protein